MTGADLWSGSVPLGSVLARLLVASIAGGLLGFERERLEKPAGLRTHMLVALGSATFVLLALEMGEAEIAGEGFDPTRVLQGIVGGLGFLGAGSIIQARGHVSGITTAASVWMAGALGCAAGFGAYQITAIATVLAILILSALGAVEALIRKASPPRPPDEPPGPDDAPPRDPPPAQPPSASN